LVNLAPWPIQWQAPICKRNCMHYIWNILWQNRWHWTNELAVNPSIV
jgi:hypothetical protein